MGTRGLTMGTLDLTVGTSGPALPGVPKVLSYCGHKLLLYYGY